MIRVEISSKLNNFSSFSYRNSKPLLVSEGYWAEPWALTEVPLCAVIDPSKDYRWHALRCGGPETAGFLCEMEGKIFITFLLLFFLFSNVK